MAGETLTTIIGNLTASPELRFTQGGTAVAHFTIASSTRTFDRQAGEWRDGDTLFLRCVCWNRLAENTAESLRRGSRVVAHGRLRQRSYEKDDEKRTVIEFEIDDIGLSLRYATANAQQTDSVPAEASA
ncbi:single-stranded DNA-binding protein [Saccharothrix violaceirubra]|uniref:Single-stranded DNA-binding protein n=1 Tax=Saccharothrix violaceirubra TaxID=413306 RepID=A0A7W7SYZ7_9PSEU|nr:single-strand DNA-binding protein [Saccharothrix violaceirubra]